MLGNGKHLSVDILIMGKFLPQQTDIYEYVMNILLRKRTIGLEKKQKVKNYGDRKYFNMPKDILEFSFSLYFKKKIFKLFQMYFLNYFKFSLHPKH